MMRFGLCALALLGLAACSPGTVEVNGANGDRVVIGGKGGYTLQVVGSEAEQVYLVTAPDGRTAAAKASGGASSVIGAAEAQTLVAGHQSALSETGPGGDDVNIRVPGFSLQVSDGGPSGGRDRVRLKTFGIDLDVDADEGAGGDRAVVRIGGVDAKSAREFIDGADGLSAETRAEMYQKLGL